jgi:hypothetical protein
MSPRMIFGLVAMWVVSLFAVAAIAMAQTAVVPLPSPVVLSGADIGFRIEGKQGEHPVGQLVVRINGQWVEATLGVGRSRVHPLQ